MDEKKIYHMALNLSDPPWYDTSIDFDQAEEVLVSWRQ